MNHAEATAVLTVPTIDDALKKVVVAQSNAAALRDAFAPHFQKAHELAAQAALVKSDEPKRARLARLALREVRIAAEHTRKATKDESLRLGKAIDGIYNVLEYQVAPIEKALQEIEDAEEIRERNRKAALAADRSEKLRPYLDPTHLALGEMEQQAFDLLLSGAIAAHKEKVEREAREKAQREAEAVRVEAERKAKEEADRLERERLARVAQEQAAIAKAEREAREAAEAKARAEKQAAEAAMAKERHKAEAAEAEAKRMRDEAAAKQEAERKAKAKAERAPEKAKVAKLAADVRALQIPSVTSTEGKALVAQIRQQVEKFAAWLDLEGGRL